ncbi:MULTISPECIES: antibiotic biosynthesis monooxygenase family protein [unclassified Streptomyces]|jgi:heme-degrading monooxygenase HmoA|uniref:antibiotic biosynthesis monooxygenase family protein n=1 Tax=unclassified Streptomyces TaxID=2593676 RepID=UPI002E25BC50
MTRISVKDQYYTLVNIFETSPEHQHRLIDIWQSLGAADERTGLVSVNAHLSHDGNSVISYIQWRDKAAWENILVDPGRQERFKEVLTFATFDSIHCEVVHTGQNPSLDDTAIEISERPDVFTVIEVARTRSRSQQETLLEAVTQPNAALDATPGYISHTVHRDFEGEAVVSYAQWQSEEAYRAFRAERDTRGAKPAALDGVDVREYTLKIAYITEATKV